MGFGGILLFIKYLMRKAPVTHDPTSKVVHVSSADQYLSMTKQPNKLVVVDFSAEWCGPCRAIRPKYDQLSKVYPDVVFLHVDIDELRALDDVRSINSVPTFRFYKNGPKAEIVGANVTALENHIQKYK